MAHFQGVTWLGSNMCDKSREILLKNKSSLSHLCDVTMKKATAVLGYMKLSLVWSCDLLIDVQVLSNDLNRNILFEHHCEKLVVLPPSNLAESYGETSVCASVKGSTCL